MQLKISGISKSFEDKTVIDNLTLKLPQTGNVAIMGKSGCGKTTLLKIIAGIVKPDSGTVNAGGGSKISFVFQEDRLLDVLTARENIEVVLKKDSADTAAVAEGWLSAIGLSGEGGKYPRELSGGMNRRIAVARALAFGGEVLILDEPFNGLDIASKEKITELTLRGFDARRRLNIFAVHDVDDAVNNADKVIVFTGPPLRIKEEFSIDIPPEKRGSHKDVLIWHKDFLINSLM